jgi:hypothetical protein
MTEKVSAFAESSESGRFNFDATPVKIVAASC